MMTVPPKVEYGNLGYATERIVDNAVRDHSFSIIRTQDCDEIIKGVKASSDLKTSTRPNTQRSQKYLGSVPNILAVEWAKEWNVTLYSKEWMQLAARRLKYDSRYAKLRAE